MIDKIKAIISGITKCFSTAKTAIIITGIVVFLFVFLLAEVKTLRNKNVILKQNTNFALHEKNRYKTSDSLNVLSIEQLNLSLRQLKEYRAKDYKEIEKLKLDKKRIKSLVTSQQKTIYNLKLNVRDSLIFVRVPEKELKIDTIKVTNYEDGWLSYKEEIKGNNSKVYIENRDSLVYVEHIIPHKFLFIKWGQKDRKQEIYSKNPHTIILDAKFIKIKN